MRRLFIALLLLLLTTPCFGGQRYIRFDAQTGGWTATNTLTSATSGITAVIRDVRDDGTTGVLELNQVSGTFQDDEIIYEASYGSEIHISANAASDPNGNEADATTGLTSYGTPTLFESTSLGTPDTGSYHIHVTGDGATDGFYINLGASTGEYYIVTFANKMISGEMKVYAYDADSNVLYNPSASTNSSYENNTAIFKTEISAYVLLIFFQNGSGTSEWYVDNLSIKQITNAALINGFPYGGGATLW